MIRGSPPLPLKPGSVPGVRAFATLAALDACVRGLMITVMPLAVYRALAESEQLVSRLYFVTGVVALFAGLLVPWATRHVPRRWMYTLGALCYVVGLAGGAAGGPVGMSVALGFNAVGTVTLFVCLNAYVLDYVARGNLARAESTRMLFAATPWAIGPILGVALLRWWPPAPFLLAMVAALTLVGVFWYLRLGNGKAIQRARGPAPNAMAYIGVFLRQPRLVAGWLFAVIRSCGWWVYTVYVPIYCVQTGLGERVAGLLVSGANALLYLTPLILVVVQRTSVRLAVRTSFAVGGSLMILASLVAGWPWAAVAVMAASALFLVTLDACGSLPFLMAVRPGQRTEMAAVFSSYRDVSGILTPGAAWLVLLAFPLSGVFAVCGVAMWGAWALAATVHPRLGRSRRPGTLPVPDPVPDAP